MNYRHAYHAGNPADVFKHAVLVALVRRLQDKPKPLCLIDTHAGVGLYDLAADPARRTGEAATGIGRLLADPSTPAPLRDYLALVRAAGAPRFYPGSPALARLLLRPTDRLLLNELHPEDAAVLKRWADDDPRIAVHGRDGYEALKALLPPTPRRGLVLVDPPFEKTDEFARMVKGLAAAHRRWPTGHIALWYPIKHRAPVDAFHGDLAMLGIPGLLAVEWLWRAPDDPARLNGNGLILANPPWGMEERLVPLLAALVETLGQAPGGDARLTWLTPPAD